LVGELTGHFGLWGAVLSLLVGCGRSPLGLDDANAAGARPLPHRGAETVLVVEDDASVRRLTRRALEELGYTVLEAGDAADAMAIAARHREPLHLVLADVVLPGGSGREVVDALLAERPTVRVLFMSGYASDALVQHRVSELGVPFLEKPFTVDGLAAAVRGALA
jgi:DNA-binding NtrC family response regulator